jgi:hypothetical protein
MIGAGLIVSDRCRLGPDEGSITASFCAGASAAGTTPTGAGSTFGSGAGGAAGGVGGVGGDADAGNAAESGVSSPSDSAVRGGGAEYGFFAAPLLFAFFFFAGFAFVVVVVVVDVDDGAALTIGEASRIPVVSSVPTHARKSSPRCIFYRASRRMPALAYVNASYAEH